MDPQRFASITKLPEAGGGEDQSQLEQKAKKLKASLNSTTPPADSPVRGLS